MGRMFKNSKKFNNRKTTAARLRQVIKLDDGRTKVIAHD